MSRALAIFPLFASVLLTACPEASPAASEASSAKASVAPEPVTKADADTKAPEPAGPPPRKVKSGLDLGMRFETLELCRVGVAEPTCGPQLDGGTPTLLVNGSLEDERFVELLLDLQALQRRYVEPSVRAVVVLEMPPGDALAQRVDELAKRRRLELPVYTLSGDAKTWSEHYRMTSPATLMLADAERVVRFHAIAPDTLDELDAAIVAAGVEVEIADR